MSNKELVGEIEGGREKGFLYYVDGEGKVWKTPMARGGKKKDKEGK